MVVDIGGGTTEIAVISLGGIVAAHSLRVAGDKLNSAIIDYVREVAGLLIGERTAENLKISIGSALEMAEPMSASARGRDTATGLPKEIILTDQHIREAMSPVVKNIALAVKAIVEVVPPEVISDLWKRGILLTGGGAMLRGLDKLLSDTTNMPVSIADDPLTCVARGAGAVAEDLENLREMLVSIDTPIRAQ
jgi:rod shape-determining protein MreB